MDHVTTNVAADQAADNVTPVATVTVPADCRCARCGQPALPWRKKRKNPDCRPVELLLSNDAKTRRILLQLLLHSRLPQAAFATAVLGVDQATLYRYLHGARIPASKATMMRNIEYIGREGSVVHIVVRTSAESRRWQSMHVARERMIALPEAAAISPLAQQTV